MASEFQRAIAAAAADSTGGAASAFAVSKTSRRLVFDEHPPDLANDFRMILTEVPGGDDDLRAG
jgi:hypothetical protein